MIDSAQEVLWYVLGLWHDTIWHSLNRTLDFVASLIVIMRHDILVGRKSCLAKNVAGLVSGPDESSDGGGLR